MYLLVGANLEPLLHTRGKNQEVTTYLRARVIFGDHGWHIREPRPWYHAT